LSVVRQVERNFLVKRLDEEVKQLVFVDFTVCLLLVFGHIFTTDILTIQLCKVLNLELSRF